MEQQLTANYSGALRPFLLHFVIFLLLTGLASASPVNINTASTKELTSLPFIGQSRAEAIIAYRRQHGHFRTAEDLLQVQGIGDKSLAAIKPLITLGGTKAQPTEKLAPPLPDNIKPMNIRSGQIMLLPDGSYYPTLLKFLAGARHRIDMAMYIFKKGKSRHNRPARVARALAKAQQRGVKVQVVLENSDWNDSVNEENRRVARFLRRHKVQVRLDSRHTTSHGKLVVIDQRFVFVGSHNMTHSALGKNNEMSLLLDSPKVARQMQRYIERIR